MTQDNKAITIGLIKAAAAALIFIIPMIFWVANVESKLTQNEKNNIEVAQHFKEEKIMFDDLNKKDDDNELKYVQIQTQLE